MSNCYLVALTKVSVLRLGLSLSRAATTFKGRLVLFSSFTVFVRYPSPSEAHNEYRTSLWSLHLSITPPVGFFFQRSRPFLVDYPTTHTLFWYLLLSSYCSSDCPMLYQVHAKLSFFKQSRIFHIVTKSSHRRVIFLLLVLFFLCSMLPPQSILQPFTPRLDHDLGHHEQINDQNPFEEEIWSSGAARAWPDRAEKVKAAFTHAYVGYKTYAFGMDELKPLSNGGVNK